MRYTTNPGNISSTIIHTYLRVCFKSKGWWSTIVHTPSYVCMCILDAIHNEQKLNKCRKCNSTEEKAACLRVCFKISPLITVLFQSLISITAFLLRGRLIVPGVLQITDKRHNKSNKSIPQRKAPSVTAQTHWPISLRVTLTLCVCVFCRVLVWMCKIVQW